jgi:hypothetical protein
MHYEVMEPYEYNEKPKNPIYRCRGCNSNLASGDIYSIYQRQKIIQNTVRVLPSLYTMNLAALSSYQPPSNIPQIINGEYFVPAKVYWNQMSDRASPSHQQVKITPNASSTRHTITRERPGALSPGGDGVDIKHNYYGRHLNKLKQGFLRRGPITPTIPVNGGKVVNLSIINGCNCDNNDIQFLW